MTILTVAQTKQWMEEINKRMKEHKEQLTELDQAIGDGDHGINMARGFSEVINKIADTEYDTVADVLKSAAMTLTAKVGGASGPLYGTAFLKMSMALQNKDVNQQNFQAAMEAALEGIKMRGKAEFGEKTMYDVWYQVTAFLKSEKVEDWQEMMEVCQATLEDTREMVATKGRASYLNERSIGHIDPGSMSSFYIFEALVAVLEVEE
ncbi:phosphoenolpyruvate-dihydroxyacetone phosphotransferase [Gracilibacillus boraciitolerans JCM 21714]|uniref:phosphoenolpyruvate--glycerone phosphotransferase n=1 Tax=Gracilibacillus boraciitolerans JCM 21714 TaxID=1298598 RepID=W4VEZ7_9BACI|nr:dihydroxyacetone kinase subunit DhaL [Gracilibacillus boraciitolerans]GAE91950.1 phosphoenolpyruvate-dihydroxyacetone phosphotransferase [Gracilibacillus boraciitolerans JCM 21714]